MRGRQRALSIRSVVVVRIVLVRAVRIMLVVGVNQMNQPRILKQ